jgi:hypothetical protein
VSTCTAWSARKAPLSSLSTQRHRVRSTYSVRVR